MFLQTFLLALTARGLGTCVQVSIAGYPEIVREQLNISQEYAILCGMAIGYPTRPFPLTICAPIATRSSTTSSFTTRRHPVAQLSLGDGHKAHRRRRVRRTPSRRRRSDRRRQRENSSVPSSTRGASAPNETMILSAGVAHDVQCQLPRFVRREMCPHPRRLCPRRWPRAPRSARLCTAVPPSAPRSGCRRTRTPRSGCTDPPSRRHPARFPRAVTCRDGSCAASHPRNRTISVVTGSIARRRATAGTKPFNSAFVGSVSWSQFDGGNRCPAVRGASASQPAQTLGTKSAMKIATTVRKALSPNVDNNCVR